MFNTIYESLPRASTLSSFAPDLGDTAYIISERIKDGTFFFFIIAGCAAACLVLGFILKNANEMSPKPASISDETREISITILEKPKGLINGGNTCFISALFQTFMNDPKLCAEIVEIGKYTIAQKQDEAPWQFVLDTIKNYPRFNTSLAAMRALSIDEKAKNSGVMGDPQELMLGMLRNVPTDPPRENEKPFFKKEEVQGFKSLYFEEVRVVQWKESADQTNLEADNLKTDEQKDKDFSVFSEYSRETIPAWCMAVDMEKPPAEGETREPLTLQKVIEQYFKTRGIKDKTSKKALDSNKKVVRYETVSERVEFGDEKPSKFFLQIKRFVAKDQPVAVTTNFSLLAQVASSKMPFSAQRSVFSGLLGGSQVTEIATSKQLEEGKSSVSEKKIEKINTPIPIEAEFLKQLGANTQTPYQISLKQDPWKGKYTLQSIVLHSSWGGISTELGHYTTLARNNGVWWVCDDKTVTQATKNDVEKYLSQGYLYQFNLEEAVKEPYEIVIGSP